MTEYLDLVFCDCWNFEKEKDFVFCVVWRLNRLETESSPLQLMIVIIKEVPVSCITVGYFCLVELSHWLIYQTQGLDCSLVQEGPFPGAAMATRQMSVCTGVCFSITLDADSISA